MDIALSSFQWANLVLAALFVIAVLAWFALNASVFKRANRTGGAAGVADVSWSGHLVRFMLAFLAIAALAGLALLQTGWLLESFSASTAMNKDLLDGQSFVGLIGIWIAAPVAFASALYAIYLAHAALQLAKGQNTISENQLELDRTVNDPDRPVFVEGINGLLDLDSAAMALASLGQLQLRERSCIASERDALRAQLASVLGAINSPAFLKFVNRTPERRVILERIMVLRSALFRANEVNHGMPLRSDYSDQQYEVWSKKRGKWAFEMAAELSSVLRESIRVVASVRRACSRMQSLAELPVLQRTASGAGLAEAAALDQVVDGMPHARSDARPISRGVVEVLDDGESMDKLLALLASGLVEVPSPGDPGASTQVEPREWAEWVRDFSVGADQYTIFYGFRDFWRVLYNEERRGADWRSAGLGKGLVIIIDTPYGAEHESPEVKTQRDVETSLKAADANATKFTGEDYSEPERIWELARQLSRLPANADLLKQLLASSRAVAVSAGVSAEAGADALADWDDVKQLIDLQNRLARTPVEELKQLADEHYSLDGFKLDRLVWISLNTESERQRDGAGDWWFRKLGGTRYMWSNEPSELHRFGGAHA